MTGSTTGSFGGHGEGQVVKVLFFASAREAAGTPSVLLGAAGKTVGQLHSELVAAYGPDLERVLRTCAIWVNGASAPPSCVLREGDEVAVLPPVSGGA